MKQLLYDAIDIALMRFKPLREYQYPQWQPLLLLLGLSLANVPFAYLLHTDLLSKLLFLFTFVLVQSLVFARFLRLWLLLPLGKENKPLSNWDGQGNLLTLLILVQGLTAVKPLLLWLEPGLQLLLGLALFIYSWLVPLRALAACTETRKRVIVGAAVLYLPMFVMIGLIFGTLAMSWGWMDPAELKALSEGRPLPQAQP